jgi:hypothetical protein
MVYVFRFLFVVFLVFVSGRLPGIASVQPPQVSMLDLEDQDLQSDG